MICFCFPMFRDGFKLCTKRVFNEMTICIFLMPHENWVHRSTKHNLGQISLSCLNRMSAGYQSQILYMWKNILACNLILVSIILLCLAIFVCWSSSMKLGPDLWSSSLRKRLFYLLFICVVIINSNSSCPLFIFLFLFCSSQAMADPRVTGWSPCHVCHV